MFPLGPKDQCEVLDLIEGYGMSEAQATKFFKKDTTITIGMSGSTRFVSNGSMIIGTRFVGD